MSELTPEANPQTPVITPRVRTILYISFLIVNVAVFVGVGLGTIFNLIDSEQATQATALIISGIGMASGALNVGYRPTK